MSLSKIVVIVVHVVVAVSFALFAGWAVSIGSATDSFTFWAGAFMGGLSYSIFVVTMIMLMERWGRDE